MNRIRKTAHLFAPASVKASGSIVRSLLWVALFVLPGVVSARPIAPGERLTTFDPFGDTAVDATAEGEALDDLRPTLMFSLGYTYTYRTGFDHELAASAVEQMHMWTVGINYMPWTFLFMGAALPLATAKFEGATPPVNTGPSTLDPLPEYDWTGGVADLSTYVGSELPWIPLTLTAMLMWPTGDIEKGMGTGEFSLGFMADLSLTFGKVSTKVGGFYFLLKDPTVTLYEQQVGGTVTETEVIRSLPNAYGASASATLPVGRARLGVGFRWSYRTLITWEGAHVLEPSFKMVWPVNNWFATVLNAGVEVYPTVALVPTLAFVWTL